MRIIIILFFLSLITFGCKKKNQNPTSSNSGNATLTLTINGKDEAFAMSDPDFNSIGKVNCFSFTGSNAIIENLTIRNFDNGSFTLSAGNETITNKNFNCQVNASDFCGTPHIEIWADGNLNTRLEQLYNVPIYTLEPSSNSTVKVSDLGQNKASVNWSGNLNVLDFNGEVLGVFPATFSAIGVAITDNR